MNKMNLVVLTKLQIFRQYIVSNPQYVIYFEQWKWSQGRDGYFWNIFESLSVYILKKMLSFLFPFISGIVTLNNIPKHPGNVEFVHKLFLNPHLCALFLVSSMFFTYHLLFSHIFCWHSLFIKTQFFLYQFLKIIFC